MHIVMVGHAYPPTQGGVETHLADLSRLLTVRGHRVTCVVGGEYDTDEYDGQIHVVRRRVMHPSELFDAHRARSSGPTRRILRTLSEGVATADLVHCHNVHHFGPHIADAVFAAFPDAHVPKFNTVHDHAGEHVLDDVLRQRWDHLLYVSDFVRHTLPGHPGTPATTLHLGIDLTRFGASGPPYLPFVRLTPPVIFHPARLLRWKGVDVGLEAFIRLQCQGTLVLTAGDDISTGNSESHALRQRLEKRAADAGVRDRIHFEDVPFGQMSAALRSSDLVWYPTTDDEPFGLAPLEAMACGRPVVITASGGMREATGSGTCVVVPKGDFEALAAAALGIFRDPVGAARMTAAALKHVRTSRGLDDYVVRLEKIYAGAFAPG